MGDLDPIKVEVPEGILSDDPRVCKLCFDVGVTVDEFESVGEYCELHGIQPEQLDRLERVALDKSYPYRVARPCPCLKGKASEERYKAAAGPTPRALEAARFEGVHRHIPYKVEALKAAKAIVANAIAGAGGYIEFAGQTGAGKTYVALAAVRAVIEAGKRAKRITSQEFCDTLREKAGFPIDQRRYVDGIKSYDLIVLDDVGSERFGPEDGTVRNLYRDFLRAFENGGALIITSNYDVKTALTDEKRLGKEALAILRRLEDIRIAPTVRFG